MLNENLFTALSSQFNAELYSSYLYLSMSSYCDRKGFKGFAGWLSIQAQEELAHAMHMYQYILERGNCPKFGDIKASAKEYSSVTEIFEEILKHEQRVSNEINSIATLAMEGHDHSAYQFIQWYVNEQVEEEANIDLILNKLKHIGDNSALLYGLDKEMGARVFVNPFPKAVN